MTRNGIFLSVLAVILAAVYVIYFLDIFHKPTIQILPQVRPGRASAIPRDRNAPPVYPVAFKLNGKYKLTSVKVVNAADAATNKYPEPLWHMISDSNSTPQDWLMYGLPIKGMKPAVPRAKPQPLEPDVNYLLIIAAGKIKGQTNFVTREYVALPSR